MRLLPLILFAASCCISCNDTRDETSFFQGKLKSAFMVTEVNEKIVGADSFELAPGTLHPVLRVSVYANGFERRDYCLLVKAPFEVEPGELKFVTANDFERPCSDYLFEKAASESKEFYNLRVDFKTPKLAIKADQKEFTYLFQNMAGGPAIISVVGGHSRSDSAELKKGEVCLSVSDDCSASEDRCDRCPGGSYYVKNSSCLNGYSKICGEDKCGQKGEPACIRGQTSTGVKDYCIQDSPVGFCSEGGRVGCVNGLLICE